MGATTNPHFTRLRGTARSLLATAVLGAGLTFAASASAADTIYWANAGGNTIGYANLSGGGGGTLDTTGVTPDDPQAVAIDPATGLIYWVNRNNNTLDYANLVGGGGGALNTSGATLDSPTGLAIDPANNTIYWANSLGGSGTGSIQFASLAGGGGGTLSTTGATVDGPFGLAVDPATGLIYWANNGSNPGKVSFAKLDNSGGGGDLDTTGATFSYATSVAIDPALGLIYWTANAGNRISFANLNDTGGAAALNLTGATVDYAHGLAIDQASGVLYFADNGNGNIGYANANDTGHAGALSTTGTTTNDPAGAALLQAPQGSGAPSISGGTLVGTTLTCSQGSWSADLLPAFDFLAPQSLSYSWTENGSPIASSSTITASSAGSYACQVSAANHAGSSSQSSAAVTIAAPPPVVVPPPVLSGLSLTPARFHAATSGASIASKKQTGASISYSDSQAATTTFTVLRRVKGYEQAGSCVAKHPAGHGKPKRCALYETVGTFTHVDTAGINAFHFTGRVASAKLKRGAYELQAVPTFAGKTGATVTATFSVLK